MNDDSKIGGVRSLDRINLRLSGEAFKAIDAARGQRPGMVSRNTWLTEAVEEKLAREQAEGGSGEDQRRHG